MFGAYFRILLQSCRIVEIVVFVKAGAGLLDGPSVLVSTL